ncbi:MAG: Asp-tRNA(Asn)/Glu-tRNA(Gln) amidotransferase subunit GatB [Prosthecobacter sp.]|nr:Asp-tRNA(Asn)/Glu-tRNA(Gln) amidotransferase subunit GatB [Prosthecobacter sp.]
MPPYIVTIGLEVHAQLTTRSKMFCACPVEFGAEPNTHTCPTCLGLPGALPVLNEGAIEKTILTGLMLGCATPPVVNWDRKNYFYPDMPKNYQITQYAMPLCLGGGVPLYELAYPKDAQKTIKNPGKVVKLTRIHLEEDVAKSTHHEKFSTIDFNRAGTPLMEIVSDPDLDSAEEVVAYLGSLRQILIYGGVSDADMEKGQMRCDVNISVRPEGQAELGVKIELKNLNSISAIRRAIKYETERQIDCVRRGEKLKQSTRRWDDDLGVTDDMRSKEDAHDYRYFPDPDLLPVRTAALVERVRPQVPELPHDKRARFERDYGCSAYDASVLSSEKALASWYEAAVAADAKVPAKKIANWVINDLLGALNNASLSIGECPVQPAALNELAAAIETGKISNNQAKEVFAGMFETGKGAAEIIKARGFEQVSDTGALEAMVDQVIDANPAKVEEVMGGNDKALNWFTGQVMKLSGGKANPKVVTELVRSKIDQSMQERASNEEKPT